jgi:PBP1b-binding outer membrane lipoprotein LpoB
LLKKIIFISTLSLIFTGCVNQITPSANQYPQEASQRDLGNKVANRVEQNIENRVLGLVDEAFNKVLD